MDAMRAAIQTVGRRTASVCGSLASGLGPGPFPPLWTHILGGDREDGFNAWPAALLVVVLRQALQCLRLLAVADFDKELRRRAAFEVVGQMGKRRRGPAKPKLPVRTPSRLRGRLVSSSRGQPDLGLPY